MATYSLHRLIMGKVEIGNFYCLIGDNRILFLQKCLLNSSPHFIKLLSELPYLIGCSGHINSYFSKKVCFSRTLSRFKVHQVHFYGIMLRLHLPRVSYDLFVYDFPYGFQASWE